MDECVEEGLLQATMRNKKVALKKIILFFKLLWQRLTNITSEGKAEYEKALAKAFTTLMKVFIF